MDSNFGQFIPNDRTSQGSEQTTPIQQEQMQTHQTLVLMQQQRQLWASNENLDSGEILPPGQQEQQQAQEAMALNPELDWGLMPGVEHLDLDAQAPAEPNGFHGQVQFGSPFDAPNGLQMNFQSHVQPQPLPDQVSGPPFRWSCVSTGVVHMTLGANSDAVFVPGGRPQICFWQPEAADTDIFLSLDQPQRCLEYGLFEPMPKLPVYSTNNVLQYWAEVEENFVVRFERVHLLWACGISACNSERIIGSQEWDDELNLIFARRFNHFRKHSPSDWVQRLLDGPNCFSEAEIDQVRFVCGQVRNYQTLMSALVQLCWMTLYWKYSDVGGHPCPDLKASCYVAARRWTLNIVWGWSQDVWGQACRDIQLNDTPLA